MGTRKKGNGGAELEATRRRFERWRRGRPLGRRIPEPLWAAAVKMADKYGVSLTASALRVDYYSLKNRLEGEGSTSASSETDGAPTFVELPAPMRIRSCECTVEWENAGGAKMRVHLRGVETPDLVALSRSFWES